MSRLGLIRADSLDARKSHKHRSKRHIHSQDEVAHVETVVEETDDNAEEKSVTRVVDFSAK